ncbi:L-lactate MFS transporter [Tissierella creatinophila]|uniref:Putative MFS-type transporter YhjX n=1 Tax=Tissierella creatinophila DSM 6911 TaxID=1123403 RepID=A0A1U7M3K5_TISCR|nr:OFA family MFS transporter [Tissierella creatinophila]OLS01897.1 putative MFS-type transporter YhjX [Tissierella creatinophila DSM 6911]
MFTVKNKYIVLIGALLAQITIAGLYAWSIFGTALQTERGWSGDATFFPYALAQFIFAFSTLLSGRIVDKRGPRIALIIGGVLYGGGLILSSFVTSAAMLYLTYGVIAGAGVGFVYVCPLSTLIKWFPNNKGTITGLSVAIFGGGSIIFKEVISGFLETTDVSGAFLKLGIISMILILTGAIFTNNPESYEKKSLEKGVDDYTTSEMMKTSKFKITWVMYWLAVIPGLLVLGAAKDIGMEVAGLEASVAAGLITVLAVSNAGSRLVSGTLSDKFGTLKVLKIIFVITIASLLGLSLLTENTLMFYLSIGGVAVGYGGFLSLFPVFTNQEFGSFRYGSNYGVIYQAYGLAALTGILIKRIAGTYSTTFIISAIAATIGLGLASMLKER